MSRQKVLYCTLFCAATLTGAATAQVAVLGSPGGGAPWSNDVKAKLQASGVNLGPITLIDIASSTPTVAELQTYRSVLVYSDGPGYLDANALGTNLKAYVDSGGGVVVCTFTNASIPLGGAWISAQYDPIVPTGQTSGFNLTLGTRWLPTHPLFTISPVASFNGGSSSYHGTGTLAANSTRVANWSNGDIFAAERKLPAGRVLSLNFYPPSSSAHFDFWAAGTDGDNLMANALVYVAGRRGVAVLGAEYDESWIDDVRDKIAGSGVDVGPVSTINVVLTTPTLAELQRYKSVLVFSDYGFANQTQLGNNLKDYVDDGGGVVLGLFTHSSHPLGGTWASAGYDPMISLGTMSGTQFQLGWRVMPTHPLFTISPVASFDGGTSSYYAVAAPSANSTNLARWSSGPTFAAERIGLPGRVLGLNFFPVSSDIRPDLWSSATDGDNLMANALAYTGDTRRYAILMAENVGSTWPGEVRDKIQATGVLPGSVSVIDVRSSTPTLAELLNFKTVLVSSDANFENATELGNNLHDFVAYGRGVVETAFVTSGPALGGTWASDQYYAIVPNWGPPNGQLQLGARLAPAHPLFCLSPVPSFDGGTSSYHSVGGLAPSSIRLGNWSNGDIFAAERVNLGGLVLDLNFFPPSSDSRPDFWLASTSGDNLLANAMRYVGGADWDNNAEIYCTPKVNSLGCLPQIVGSGQGSAFWSSGLRVYAYRVRNQKPGLLMYTNGGRASTPFQSGVLCLNNPIKRSIALNSSGNALPANDCSGLFAIDMNTFARGTYGGNPAGYLSVQGTVVQCQFWGRDPGFAAPDNSTLSNALEYVIGP